MFNPREVSDRTLPDGYPKFEQPDIWVTLAAEDATEGRWPFLDEALAICRDPNLPASLHATLAALRRL